MWRWNYHLVCVMWLTLSMTSHCITEHRVVRMFTYKAVFLYPHNRYRAENTCNVIYIYIYIYTKLVWTFKFERWRRLCLWLIFPCLLCTLSVHCGKRIHVSVNRPSSFSGPWCSFYFFIMKWWICSLKCKISDNKMSLFRERKKISLLLCLCWLPCYTCIPILWSTHIMQYSRGQG